MVWPAAAAWCFPLLQHTAFTAHSQRRCGPFFRAELVTCLRRIFWTNAAVDCSWAGLGTFDPRADIAYRRGPHRSTGRHAGSPTPTFPIVYSTALDRWTSPCQRVNTLRAQRQRARSLPRRARRRFHPVGRRHHQAPARFPERPDPASAGQRGAVRFRAKKGRRLAADARDAHAPARRRRAVACSGAPAGRAGQGR